MKTLSVIIPTYNISKVYFSKCLASLQCNQYKEIEIIVVDDGSLEQYSQDIQTEIKESILDIHYFKKENGGQNSAREYGLSNAIGQYIFFLDADDYLDTGALDEIILLLKKNNPSILAFNYDVCTPDGVVLEKHMRWNEKYNAVDVHKGLLYSDSLCLQIYRKDALYQSGISLVQEVRIGEDMASATALLAAIGEEYATDNFLYHYVKHPGSALSNPSEDSALDIIHAFDKMLAQLDETIQKKYSEEFEWLAILHVLYYNTERILENYNGSTQLIKETRDWVEKKYPAWEKNSYLKSESLTRRVPFVMIRNGFAPLLKSLRKIKRRICTF